MRKIFSQIFIPFSTYRDFFQEVNLDYIIALSKKKCNIGKQEKNNDIDIIEETIFKDIATNPNLFSQNLFLAEDIYNEKGIIQVFSKLVEIILKSGIESKENKDIDDNILIGYFRDFLIAKKKDINIITRDIELNNLFKSFFIPGMMLFNKENNKNENKNLISFALNKYFKENDYEKIGGTMKYINETYLKEIQNFEEISNMKINSANNVFLLEFLEFFFCDEGSDSLWNTLEKFVLRIEEYTKRKFNSSIKNDSTTSIHNKFINFIEYKLTLPNLNDLEILVNFLKNFVNFFKNELYPKKLIYFFPEKIILRFINIIGLLKAILKSLLYSHT